MPATETNNGIEVVQYWRNDFQARVIEALEKEKLVNAFFAGWRTGKTDEIAIDHVIRRQVYDNGDVLHLIAANTYSQLIDSTLRTVFYHLDRLGIPHIPAKLPRHASPFSLFVWNGDKWVEFLCRSMDNFDIVAGVTLGSAWLDEVWNTESWTYELTLSRLSDKNSRHRQVVLTTTTDEPSHWMYTDVVAKENPKTMEIVYGTTYDNAENLSEGYIDGLLSLLDKRLVDRYIFAKWVSLSSGKILYNFSRILHLRQLHYDRNIPVMFSCDFNVNPMCWSIWQRHGNELWCIDAITVTGRADTETTAREMLRRYGDNKHFICFGDATGQSGNTKSRFTDYEIIKTVFTGRNIDFHIPAGNPSVRDSANATNARLLNARGEVNMYFDKERAKEVYLSVETVSYKRGTLEKDDGRDRDPNAIVKTHFNDTVRYIANRLFPLYAKTIGRSE